MEHDKAAEFGAQSLEAGSMANADGHELARKTSIEELVSMGPASVRLTNAISRGMTYGRLPCQTVGEYLDAGPSAQNMFVISLSNFGRKSAMELDALIHDFLARENSDLELVAPTSPVASKNGLTGVEDERLSSTLERLNDLTLTEALRGQSASARLSNALALHGLGERKVTELFVGGWAFQAELLRLRNFGRKSLNELEMLCRRAVIRTLAKEHDTPEKIAKDCGVLFRDPGEGPNNEKLTREVLETLRNMPPSNCGLNDLLEWALLELPERDRDIVARRYGLEKSAAETLEQIGEDYCVTRERIRQLEAKSIGRLREKLKGTSLRTIVTEASVRFWTKRSVPFLVIASHEINQFKRELEPHLILALDILNLSVGSWLKKTSTPMANGYLSPSEDAEKVLRFGSKLKNRLEDQPLPISLYEAIDEQEQDHLLVQAAVCLETSFVLFESYLLHDRPRARLKRAVRLHALLCAERRVLTTYELGEVYFERFQSDRCSLRDLVIVMEFSPQLFMEIEEGVWAALGKGGKVLATVEPEAETEAQADIDQSTIAGSIQEALRERGPTALGDLFRDGGSILPEGRSRNSIGPILLSRPDLFQRVLPGVFSLTDQLPSPIEMRHDPLPYLLTEAQGRIYAYGRLAGEPWGVFALWTPVAEYRLCKWARFEGAPALFHSLLAIANVEKWPIDRVQKNEWIRLKALYGRFELPPPQQGLVRERRPELDRVLAAALIATERGSIGWLQANRILGRRLDASVGQNLLALLIALGIVDAPVCDDNDVRLRPHFVTGMACDIADKLKAELILRGELHWDSPLGHALSAQAVSADITKLGWVRPEEISELLQSEPDEPPSLVQTEQSSEQESDDELMSRLIDEHRRTVELDRREKAAQWLLED